MSSLISGGDAAGDRWQVTMLRTSAGSTHQAEVPFGVDPIVTGAVGISAPGIGAISLNSDKVVLPDTPDEQRINTKGKSGRVACHCTNCTAQRLFSWFDIRAPKHVAKTCRRRDSKNGFCQIGPQ
ncbi:MAG: hypothetical protein U5K75_10800 [Ahrensia sp.]|nr:hypothetical protein [Ahrensia sp.]